MTQITIKNNSGELLKTLEVEVGKPLLKQLENAGIEIPNACRIGTCASCLCIAEKGEEHLVKNLRGEPAFPLADEEIMTCIGGVRDTDQEIILRTLD